MIYFFLWIFLSGMCCYGRMIPKGNLLHSSNVNGTKIILEYFIRSRDPGAHHSRWESVDDYSTVEGCYTLDNGQGHHRRVNYTADGNGFRADVQTNEPGVGLRNPANVRINFKRGKHSGKPCMPRDPARLPLKTPVMPKNPVEVATSDPEDPSLKPSSPPPKDPPPAPPRPSVVRDGTRLQSRSPPHPPPEDPAPPPKDSRPAPPMPTVARTGTRISPPPPGPPPPEDRSPPVAISRPQVPRPGTRLNTDEDRAVSVEESSSSESKNRTWERTFEILIKWQGYEDDNERAEVIKEISHKEIT